MYITVKKKIIVGTLLSILLFTSQLSAADVQRELEDGISPVALVQNTLIKLNRINNTYHPRDIYYLIYYDLVPLFDIQYITRKITYAIPYKLEPEDIQYLENKLEQNLTDILFEQLSKQRLTFFLSAIKPLGPEYFKVSLKISYNALNYIDLIIHRSDEQKWQIVDVLLGGHSLTAYYQKIIANKIRRYGINY